MEGFETPQVSAREVPLHGENAVSDVVVHGYLDVFPSLTVEILGPPLPYVTVKGAEVTRDGTLVQTCQQYRRRVRASWTEFGGGVHEEIVEFAIGNLPSGDPEGFMP